MMLVKADVYSSTLDKSSLLVLIRYFSKTGLWTIDEMGFVSYSHPDQRCNDEYSV